MIYVLFIYSKFNDEYVSFLGLVFIVLSNHCDDIYPKAWFDPMKLRYFDIV